MGWLEGWFRMYPDWFCVVPWNKLIRKAFLLENDIHFKEGVICEDEYWSYYLYKKLTKIAILDTNTYYHYVCPSSVMSTSNNEKRANALFVIINELKKDFDSPMRELQVHKYLEYYRNHVHSFIPERTDRRLYFWFCHELLKLKEWKIAFLWMINWFYKFKRYKLYNVLLVNAYRRETQKSMASFI